METLYINTPKIGPRLFIQHGFATNISAKQIGSDCWINQQVTIGYTFAPDPPIIGNGVRVSAGAKVVGNITIGDNAIIAANAAIIFLLERMEQAMEREQQLFSLGQQLEVQVRSMESASKLFSEQRKKVHDYRSHLNTLRVLLQNHEYEPAEVYLNSVSKQQTERLFLVNTHHSILDALFNTKASEAIQEGIEIDFRVNDLSMLPFEAADMVVLLSNLLDNAIEANRSYCGSKKIHVTALWKKSFLFSIRNTSNPVRIENNTIQTTKPDPQLHGFGLSNVKLILEKYNGDFTMDYEDNWFQFTGEISQ